MVDAADVNLKPTLVEGSVDEEAAHYVDNTAEQHQEEETNKLFAIPGKLEPGQRSLLQASDADFARGAVQEIKCRICPNKKLKNFHEFKRHCNFTEAHPLVIHFCGQCGDFFAHPDALARHNKERHRPRECREAKPDMAVQKRIATEEAHEEFLRRLEHCMATEEDIGKPFSQIIKDKYSESSKKRKGSWR